MPRISRMALALAVALILVMDVLTGTASALVLQNTVTQTQTIIAPPGATIHAPQIRESRILNIQFIRDSEIVSQTTVPGNTTVLQENAVQKKQIKKLPVQEKQVR